MLNAIIDEGRKPVVSDRPVISREDVRRVEQQARELRSQAIAGLFRGVTASLKSKIVARRTCRHLYQLDDRLLTDIGINRYEIQDVVGGRSSIDFGAVFAALLTPVRYGVEYFKERNQRYSVYRQLSTLDDRMLEDIGMTRYDVEAIVFRGKVRKPVMAAPVSFESLRKPVLSDVATTQDVKPLAA